jgi:hypothetical protein
MAFDGRALQRGFWLYVWKIELQDRTMLYIGRTGDSSSCYAASPFLRISAHLDRRTTAKGNALMRQLKRAGIDPERCKFQMLAIGPLFAEQSTFAAHVEKRDVVAALEAQLAAHMKNSGYEVLGSHPRRRTYDERIWRQVVRALGPSFPCCSAAV